MSDHLPPVSVMFKCEDGGIRAFVSSSIIVPAEEMSQLADSDAVDRLIAGRVDRWRTDLEHELNRFDSADVAKALVKHIRPAAKDGVEPLKQYAFIAGGSLLPAKEY